MKNRQHIHELFQKLVADQCTDQELALFFEFIQDLSYDDILIYELERYWENGGVHGNPMDAEKGESMHRKILNLMHAEKNNETPLSQPEQPDIQLADESLTETRPVHRIHFLKRTWWRYAAAIIILFGTGTYWYVSRNTDPDVAGVSSVLVQDVPAPSSTRATLILSDGRRIFLDSALNGTLATEGEVNIQKMSDGSIVYNGRGAGTVKFNTLVVPRGSKIMSMVLSDGSRVFLNAASSIKYPTGFSGNTREVEISGEAYFEVAKDPKKKFIVSSGAITTEVLGTHFNVSAYEDEETMAVTLLEGSVKVNNGLSNAVIKPGEQAQYISDDITINRNVDIDQVMAWKNGLFDFRDKTLEDVMKQLSRWYDVEVLYKNGSPKIELGGKLGKDLNFSEILGALKQFGIRFKLEGDGKRVIILPS